MMKFFKTSYLFPLIFIGVGIYKLIKADFLEASLYTLAGLAFIFNALASDERYEQHKKVLGRVTWILMGITALLFLWLLQFKRYF